MVLTIVSLDSLGSEFQRIRKKVKGLTQEQVSERTGFSTAHIVSLERGGSSFSAQAIEKFAQALGIKVNIILALDDQDFKRLLEAKEEE